MRKSIALVAVLALVATPALAALTSDYSVVNETSLNRVPGSGTVGIYTAASGGGILTNYAAPAAVGDVRTATFAFHWPYGTSVAATQLWFSVVWDNSEITILNSATPSLGGLWEGTNNHSAFGWSGVTNTGLVRLGNVGLTATANPLVQNPTFSTTLVEFSVINPFLRIQYSVTNPVDDGVLDLVIGSARMLYNCDNAGQCSATAGGLGQDSFGVDITPEPASLSLLALGFAATGAGAWRRRRR